MGDDWDDPSAEWEAEEADAGDSSGDIMICPSCRKRVHEETQKCPHCGDWIEPAYPESRKRRFLWFLAVGLMILLMLFIAL